MTDCMKLKRCKKEVQRRNEGVDDRLQEGKGWKKEVQEGIKERRLTERNGSVGMR